MDNQLTQNKPSQSQNILNIMNQKKQEFKEEQYAQHAISNRE